jgi:hypothetical protein
MPADDLEPDYTKLTLDECVALMERVAEEVHRDFGGLSADQLNWKPGPKQWSVGEGLEHLIAGNGLYGLIAESSLSGNPVRPFLSFIPGYSGMCGRFLINAVSPGARKIKTLSVFEPKQSAVPADQVERFEQSQRAAIEWMSRSEALDLEGTVVASPATSMIVYSLMDAWRLVATHSLRHLAQARRVNETDGFPVA